MTLNFVNLHNFWHTEKEICNEVISRLSLLL